MDDNISNADNNILEPPYRVMIVEDSSVIRNYLNKLFSFMDDIEVVGLAENGQIALEKVKLYNPEIILLDVEMPQMDGLTALPKLLELSPFSRVIMVSSLTLANARVTAQALVMGASDFMRKPESSTDKDEFAKELIAKVKALAAKERQGQIEKEALLQAGENNQTAVAKNIETVGCEKHLAPRALAFGSSTGGPQALTKIFEKLGDKLHNIPIFITQHMPPTFTAVFAETLQKASGIQCKEGEDGEVVIPGCVYIAPGGYHMVIEKRSLDAVIRLNQDEPENFCRPAVDPMFRSLADFYDNRLFTVILTGMGQDGLQGAKKVIEKGGILVAQDEESSVVWGMPGAVATAGLCHHIYSLDEMADNILRICEGS